LVVEYTSIPVKLKILKLFVRELSNILEGKESANGANGFGSANGSAAATEGDDGEGGWESDEDEEWEDVGGSSRPGSSDGSVDVDSGEDILKGIHTEVPPPFPRFPNCFVCF
jgi:hypothetical protein